MKLEADIDAATEPAGPVPGPSNGVQKGHAAVPFTCAGCGHDMQTSLPRRYTGKVRVECPDCGRVHPLRVVKERT